VVAVVVLVSAAFILVFILILVSVVVAVVVLVSAAFILVFILIFVFVVVTVVVLFSAVFFLVFIFSTSAAPAAALQATSHFAAHQRTVSTELHEGEKQQRKRGSFRAQN
jgi:hypothetical protein